MSEGLDALVDIVGEDATLQDLASNAPIEVDLSGGTERNEPEGEVEPESYNEDEVEAEASEPDLETEPDPDPEPELVDFEHYGVKGKASKPLVDNWNKHFTQKSQTLAEERRAWEAEKQALLDKVESDRRAVESRQRMVQDTLDENPDLHEHFKVVEQASRRDQQLADELKSVMEFRESIEQERNQLALEREFTDLEDKYTLENDAYTTDEIRDLAVARVVRSNYKEELEHAYQAVVGSKNGARKKASFKKLETAVNKAKSTEGTGSARKRSAPAKVSKDKRKPGLDGLLKMHMGWDESRFK